MNDENDEYGNGLEGEIVRGVDEVLNKISGKGISLDKKKSLVQDYFQETFGYPLKNPDVNELVDYSELLNKPSKVPYEDTIGRITRDYMEHFKGGITEKDGKIYVDGPKKLRSKIKWEDPDPRSDSHKEDWGTREILDYGKEKGTNYEALRQKRKVVFLESVLKKVIDKPRSSHVLFGERGLIQTAPETFPFFVFQSIEEDFDPIYLDLAGLVIQSIPDSKTDNLESFMLKSSNKNKGLNSFLVTYDDGRYPCFYNTFEFGTESKIAALSIGYSIINDEKFGKELDDFSKKYLNAINREKSNY